MAESQNIEYKTIWKDEYLKWICGFANAQGGTIYIGKDDNGKVVGIDNAKKLLEELPNKITTTLGIVVDVNQHDEESKETFEYPKEAIREALLNAVAHKDYTGASPIQISVYKDKMMIWNFGELPENWTIDTLQKKHSSVPHNPDISNAFFRLGYIEAWGRGIRKMNEQCTLYGLPMPLYYYESSGFWVEFRKDIYNEEILQSKGLNPRQIKAVLYAKEKRKITNREYQVINEVSRVTATRDLKDLVDKNIISFNEKAGAGASYELK